MASLMVSIFYVLKKLKKKNGCSEYINTHLTSERQQKVKSLFERRSEARVNWLAFSLFHCRMICTTEVQLTLEGGDEKLETPQRCQ